MENEVSRPTATTSHHQEEGSKFPRFKVQLIESPAVTKWSDSSSSSLEKFQQEIQKLKDCRLGCLNLSNWKCIKNIRNSFLVSSNPKFFSKMMKSQFGTYESERLRHMNTFPEIVHPFSNFRWIWDIFMTFVLIITLVYQPLQIAFYSDSIAHTQSAILNSVSCLIFLIDIILNFRTGYIGNDSDEVILDPRRTALRYFKTWFWVDFLSTIPFDLIYIGIEDINPHAHVYFKFFRLLELLKVLRLARVLRSLSKIQQANEIPPTYWRLINLSTLMFFMLHWLSCMHYLVADLTHGKKKRENYSWVSEMELWDSPVWEKYFHCLLRAISNMGCLGYGYVAPRSPEDVICTIVCIFIGAVWFALFIANVSNIILSLDAPHKKYDEALGHILEYMKFKHMPKELQSRVENYFEQRYHHNLFNEDEILSNLSPVLRSQLQMFNCQHLVRRLPMFQGIPNEVVHEIVASLKAEVYLPHDVILWENTIGDSMYFIQRGSVEILTTSGRVISHLYDGNFFGEMALLTNERRRVASVIATTRCEVYALCIQDFERIVHMYPEVFDDILAIAKERARMMTAEQGDSSSSAEVTIRKREQRPNRKSVHLAFAAETHISTAASEANLDEDTSDCPGKKVKDKNGLRPIRSCLEEILNMKPVTTCSLTRSATAPSSVTKLSRDTLSSSSIGSSEIDNQNPRIAYSGSYF